MGILSEQALLGSLLMVAATWWTIQISKRFYFSRQRLLEFNSRVSYPCCFYWWRGQMEGVLKLLIGVLGLIVQVWSSYDSKFSLHSHYIDSLRLVPFYIILALSGVVDILGRKRFHDLKKLDWIVLGFAYLIIAILFWNPVGLLREDYFVFSLLQRSLALVCCVFVALEARFPNSLLICLTRVYFTLVLGSWTWHIGLTVSHKLAEIDKYPTSDTSVFTATMDELDTHTRIQLISLFFTWHCGVILIIQLCIWMVTMRLAQDSRCCCTNIDTEDSDVRFENRVYLEDVDITAN